MFIRYFLTALSAIVFATAAAAQTATVPKLKAAPQIQTQPEIQTQPQIQPQLTPQLKIKPEVLGQVGTGFKRVTRDVHMPGQQTNNVLREPRMTTAKESEKNHSTLAIRGTLLTGDIGNNYLNISFQYKIPEIQDGLPEGCETHAPFQSQARHLPYGYLIEIHFKDTATKPECWRFFRDLDLIHLEILQYSVTYGQNADGSWNSEFVRPIKHTSYPVPLGPAINKKVGDMF